MCADLPQAVLDVAESLKCEVTTHDLALDYTMLNADQVLKVGHCKRLTTDTVTATD